MPPASSAAGGPAGQETHPATVAAAVAGPRTRRPDFFIVGAPKAGTTALFEYLRQHPDVFVPRVKEPMFFGADLEFLNCERMSLEEYLALFNDAGSAKRVGEGSTTYFYSELAPREILEFNPDARVIIMLREPVSLMYAWHGEGVVTGAEPLHSFVDALEAEPRRRDGSERLSGRAIRQGLYYRNIANFPAHVARYLEAFDPSRVHIVLFDDLVADPASVWRRTLEFLDLDPCFEPPFTVVNPSRQVRFSRLHNLVAAPPAGLRLVARALPTHMSRGLRVRLLQANTRVGAREPLPEHVVESLRAELAPTVQRLGALIDRDLSHWSRR